MQDLQNLIRLFDLDKEIDIEVSLNYLKSKDTRNYFIQNYKYLKSLERDKIISFINTNFESNLNNDFKIDLLDLSIYIDYFNESIYEIIVNDLYSRKNYLLKLGCFDYINNFYNEYVVRKDYNDINLKVNFKSHNILVKFQTYINLTLYNKEKYKEIVFKILASKGIQPYFYYRLANTITYKQFHKLNFTRDLEIILDKTSNLNIKQIKDIKSILMYIGND